MPPTIWLWGLLSPRLGKRPMGLNRPLAAFPNGIHARKKSGHRHTGKGKGKGLERPSPAPFSACTFG